MGFIDRPFDLEDRFEIEDHVGRGGAADVYVAMDRFLGERVALKVLRDDAGEANIRRFRREIEAMGAVRHPLVLPLLSCGRGDDGELRWLSTRYCAGGSLMRQLLGGESFTAEQVIRVALDLTSALQEMHASGWLHRDVSVGNILCEGERFVLCDLGLALPRVEPYARITATDTRSGTIVFMSLEQLMGRPLTPASDLFSLGCVLYLLLTGHQPFPSAKPRAAMQSRARFLPVRAWAPQVDHSLARAVERSLAAAPDARYQSAKEMGQVFGSLRPTGQGNGPLARLKDAWRRRSGRRDA